MDKGLPELNLITTFIRKIENKSFDADAFIVFFEEMLSKNIRAARAEIGRAHV